MCGILPYKSLSGLGMKMDLTEHGDWEERPLPVACVHILGFLSCLLASSRKITPEKKNDYGCVLSLRSQVTPASNEDTSVLTELTVGNSSKFNQLVQSGDVRAATQLANAVLHTANQLNSTTTQDKISVRNKIISNIRNSTWQQYDTQNRTET